MVTTSQILGFNLEIGLIKKYLACSILCMLVCSCFEQVIAQKSPNIIVIIADDLGWGDVGFHGSDIKTPSIDQLAKEGIILNRFYTSPICSPTRAGLLTGRYPNRYGLRNNVIRPWLDFGLDTSETVLPNVLAVGGYKNRAMIGKWHLGHSRKEFHPLRRGFTYFYGHLNGAINYFDLTREGERDWHEGYEASTDTGYATDLITNKAVEKIKEYAKDSSPFYIQVAYNAPHSPLQAKRKYLEMYGYDKNEPNFMKGRGKGNTKRQTYAAMVTNMDDGIGNMLETLNKLNISDNTLILFFSDNGAAINYGGSSGKLRGRKLTEWEGGVRAPAIIKWPQGFEGGWKSELLTGYIDVFPTLIKVAKVKRKKIETKELDGIDILPFLKNKELATKQDRNFYIGNGVLIKNNWKLIKKSTENNLDLRADLMFNLESDPYEEKSLRRDFQSTYEDLLQEIEQFENMPSSFPEPLDERPQNFKAPKNWKIKGS